MYNSSTYTYIHIHTYVHTHNVPHKHVSSHAQHTHKVGLTLSGRSTYLWLSLDGKMLTPKVSRDYTGSGSTGDSLTSGRWATTFCTDTQYNSLRHFTSLTSQTFQGYSVIGTTSHPYCTICTSGTPPRAHTHTHTPPPPLFSSVLLVLNGRRAGPRSRFDSQSNVGVSWLDSRP